MVGLGESTFLLLEYSVEHLIEYSAGRASYSPAAVTQVKVTVRKAVSWFLHGTLQQSAISNADEVTYVPLVYIRITLLIIATII